MSLIDRAEARRKSALAAVGPSDQAGSSAGLVDVSCFPDRAVMRMFLADLAWEPEAWRASNPAHVIHLNGDKLLCLRAGEAS
ncbi:BsuBI/PstI family type II restriction endonuclease [Microbacterium sp.]|uniref:BsuBI/PstI family type II restriction endonuclease n=1 Tax=Microbacterium sp. TaxID=51671 RepID=UPI0028A97C9D|nr:BsuBI/PstI family type II restriction endonuclease [Microbacterium sp.]